MGKPTKMCVFEVVTQGGFGRLLKLEEGAMLELGRWEYRESPLPALGMLSSSASGLQVHGPSGSADRISTDDANTSTAAPSGEASDQTPATGGSTGPTPRHKKRFTNFHFRKRTTDRNVAGPALAVLDAESSSSPSNNPSPSPNADTNGTGNGNGNNAEKKGDTGGVGEKEEEGVKVTIKLMALDEDGKELESVNEQVTYLHVVRFGAKPVMGMAGVGAGGGVAAANAATSAGAEGEEESKDVKDTKDTKEVAAHVAAATQVEEDKRPWVVKVVKREATVSFCCVYSICGMYIDRKTTDRTAYIPPTRNLRPLLQLNHIRPRRPSSPNPQH